MLERMKYSVFSVDTEQTPTQTKRVNYNKRGSIVKLEHIHFSVNGSPLSLRPSLGPKERLKIVSLQY